MLYHFCIFLFDSINCYRCEPNLSCRKPMLHVARHSATFIFTSFKCWNLIFVQKPSNLINVIQTQTQTVMDYMRNVMLSQRMPWILVGQKITRTKMMLCTLCADTLNFVILCEWKKKSRICPSIITCSWKTFRTQCAHCSRTCRYLVTFNLYVFSTELDYTIESIITFNVNSSEPFKTFVSFELWKKSHFIDIKLSHLMKIVE